jgi:small subunit ribosomal protein S6
LRHYELVTILSPILNQEQASEAWDRIKEFITSRNGEIVREQTWGTRRLAYPIRKGSFNFLEGSYYLTRFNAEKPFNQELETFLRLDERVLRSLLIAAEPPAPVPEPATRAAPAATAAEPIAEAAPATEEMPEAEAAPVAEEEREEEAEATAEEMAAAEAEIEEAAEERPIAEEEAAAEERPIAEEEAAAEAAAQQEEPVAQADSTEAEPQSEEERPQS